MHKRFINLSSILVLTLCFCTLAFGQETTGSIEVTVRDTTGAIVPNASITVESSRTPNSSTAGFRRTATTDDEGFQRILQVPPGTYRIVVAPTGGFAEKIVENVDVVLGKVSPVNIELGVGSTNVNVDVTSDSELPIDTTDTKIQTNISQKDAELLPKGTNFSSLLKISPATRPEPLTGGFQVDGASGSENTFIIDGQEVTNAISGTLDQNTNLPFQLVQEIQVKSSGFEAEYGGATGGVINVVTRGGSNDFRGEFGAQFRPGKLQPVSRPILNLGDQLEYIQPLREPSLGFFPTATLGGPVIKDRVWFFGSYTPQILTRERTIRYRTTDTTAQTFGRTETYRTKQTNEYFFGRLDAQPINNIRLTGTFTYNPVVVEGELPGVLTLDNDTLPSAGGSLFGTAFQDQLGGRQNAKNVTGTFVWTPTNNVVISVRGGHNFLNQKLGTYGRPSPVGVFSVLCSGQGLTPPPSAGCTRGASNGVTAFALTAFDATKRNTVDADVTYITNLLGRHEFKGGYQYNGLSNQRLSQTTDQVVLRYGRTITQTSGREITPTAPICTTGQTTSCVLGSGFVRRLASQGDVSSKNEGFFFQDKYQPVNRLTLNLGIRTERENVPSFNPEAPDVKFDFQDKIAPRIGVAYDLTGDGKTKVSGFYGWFYDRFKYELPRGSFGGEFFYDDFFEILPTDPAAFSITPNLIFGSANPTTPPIAGLCPSTGFIYGRSRCTLNRRAPTNAGLGIDVAGAVDPDIKAYRQQELTFTFERELTNKFVVQARYTRKKLDRTIEDSGFLTPTGSEAYIIGNPGFGLSAQTAIAQGFKPQKAVRKYDAFEIRLDRRFADDFYFNANYTLSRLYGNYSGLASTDEETSTGNGRTDPNVSRYFDAPFTETVVTGGETLGRLATDRPHVFKFAGAYSLDWNKRFGFASNNTTEFQTFFTAQSGTPLTTNADVQGYDNVILFGRGDLGRTETFTETDFAIRHRYRFGRDDRFTIVGEIDVLNVFNQNNELGRYTLINPNNFLLADDANGIVTRAEARSGGIVGVCGPGTSTPLCAIGTGTLGSQVTRIAQQRYQIAGSSVLANNINAAAQRDERFNLSDAFQAPRQFRFGFRLLF
jgi:Carboxypeptidase regulatory-like domain/TonB-dependent Receptor Plug Domain